MIVIHWLVAESTPHPLEHAAFRIENCHAMIAITIGDKQFIQRREYKHVRRPVYVAGVDVALALVAVADLHHELAILRELQDLIVCDGLESRQSVRRAVVSAEPYESFV